MFRKILFFLFGALLTATTFAQHTFSICAVDTVTGEVGSAGASCINHSVIISDVHPGVGVVHTQAQYMSLNQDVGRALMNAGLTPQEIVDSLVAGDFIQGAPNRQYGVVKLHNGSPLSASFTGTNCIDYKNHITGPYYSIQGNILLGQAILDSMEARFLNTEGDLACRLMAAMQGANVVGADTRCTGSGNSSLSSFLRVAQPTDNPDSPGINIIIDSGPIGYEPIDSLQTLFNQIKSCAEDTGTGIHSLEYQVEVFCIPFTKEIVINSKLSGSFVFELFDSSGKTIVSKNLHGQKTNTVLLSKSPAGIYHWRISAAGKTTSGKLFIEYIE